MRNIFKNSHSFINGFAVGYLLFRTNLEWIDILMYFIAAITFVYKKDF